MKNVYFVFSLVLVLLFVLLTVEVPAQKTRKKRPTTRKKTLTVGRSEQPKPKLKCSSQSTGNEEKSYIVGASIVSKAEKERIDKKWGTLVIPEGEAERAKEIHQKALDFRQGQLDLIAESYKIWEQKHPNATAEEIKIRREKQERALNHFNIKPRTQLYVAEKRWDWREYSIDVGPVLNQEKLCNTCWAFAATDAAAASIQKQHNDRLYNVRYRIQDDGDLIWLWDAIDEIAQRPTPFVQDLINCMTKEGENACQFGWHGRAFDYMVYGDGIPMAYVDGFSYFDQIAGKQTTFRRQYVKGQKFACQPRGGFLKAASWDYVSATPDKVPPVEELKTALIEHGPLAMPIFYDECLRDYRSGVFNEQDNAYKVNHVVLLVGWDDDKQAWLIKNSWGTKWGENGFAWIKYGSNNIGQFAAWIDAVND